MSQPLLEDWRTFGSARIKTQSVASKKTRAKAQKGLSKRTERRQEPAKTNLHLRTLREKKPAKGKKAVVPESPSKGAGLKSRAVGKSLSNEAVAWAAVSEIASAAFDFWNGFLDLRAGGEKLGTPEQSRFLCVIRSVSWQESRHGTGAGRTAGVDPMQCGNPKDAWWRELNGSPLEGDLLIGGPLAGKWYASDLPRTMKTTPGFPPSACLSDLSDPRKGHDAADFNQTISYYWAVPILVHKTNTGPGIPNGKTYECGNCDFERLIRGAVNYNGGGVANYGRGIRDALSLSGCYQGAPSA